MFIFSNPVFALANSDLSHCPNCPKLIRLQLERHNNPCLKRKTTETERLCRFASRRTGTTLKIEKKLSKLSKLSFKRKMTPNGH